MDVPHINQQAHALKTSVLRQTVWFSPLGEANQEMMEKAVMKMMEMRRDQLLYSLAFVAVKRLGVISPVRHIAACYQAV
jgi:hypothetical protein